MAELWPKLGTDALPNTPESQLYIYTIQARLDSCTQPNNLTHYNRDSTQAHCDHLQLQLQKLVHL
jgi:hypothetical protein